MHFKNTIFYSDPFSVTSCTLTKGQIYVQTCFLCKDYKVLSILSQWTLSLNKPSYSSQSKMPNFIKTHLSDGALVARGGCILATVWPWGKIFWGFPSDILENIWCEFKETWRGSGDNFPKNWMIWRGLTQILNCKRINKFSHILT